MRELQEIKLKFRKELIVFESTLGYMLKKHADFFQENESLGREIKNQLEKIVDYAQYILNFPFC